MEQVEIAVQLRVLAEMLDEDFEAHAVTVILKLRVLDVGLSAAQKVEACRSTCPDLLRVCADMLDADFAGHASEVFGNLHMIARDLHNETLPRHKVGGRSTPEPEPPK